MLDTSPYPHVHDLQRLLLGQVSDEEAAGLEQHLNRCERCCQTAQEFTGDDPLVAAMRGAGEALPLDATLDSLIERLCRLTWTGATQPPEVTAATDGSR